VDTYEFRKENNDENKKVDDADDKMVDFV